MPRVRWCPLPVLCLFVYHSIWIAFAAADCWYDEKRYEEASNVPTLEPCLNCTCTRSVLLCYLRVCPKLPNPPPPGCILLHKYKTCCPELICTDLLTGENDIEARSEPDDLEFDIDKSTLRNACLANGTVYGPGSAMSSSRRCEYCFCLGGRQRCVKPKCLLPTEGCDPIYETHSCCPVKYNCTRSTTLSPISTTTTAIPDKNYDEEDGCIVEGKFYPEGGLVLGVGHSICDNCYCIRNMLRCEPLSCAPPLLGCTPVIRTGECCAASYNCSGTIETEPEPNYGQFPVVSKEYAKLRKEYEQKIPANRKKQEIVAENNSDPFYVIAESSNASTTKIHRSPGNYGTTRHFIGTTKYPSYYSSNEKRKNGSYPGVYYATTNYEFQNKNYKRPISTTYKPIHTTFKSVNQISVSNKYSKPVDYDEISDTTFFKLLDSLLYGNSDEETIRGRIDERSNRREDNTTEKTIETTFLITTTSQEPSTVEDIQTTNDEVATTVNIQQEIESTTEVIATTDLEEPETPVTVKTVKNSTDCVQDVHLYPDSISKTNELNQPITIDPNEINGLQEVTEFDENILSSTDSSETSTLDVSTEADVAEVDLEFKVNVDRVSMNPVSKINTISNITKSKDDPVDYDYNDLPPSLPNLRIIPFVAADALDSKKPILQDSSLPHERITESSIYTFTNLFSPPIETEGGFVPKSPPILGNFYKNSYHTTGMEKVTPPPLITTTPLKDERSCISNGQEIIHGEPVNSDSPCIVCMCLYGNIVCKQPHCPFGDPGCRLVHLQENCCPSYICENDSAAPVLLDRLDATSDPADMTMPEEIVPAPPDPFRDVIRTEPAPDLSITDNETHPLEEKVQNTYGSIFLDKIFSLFSEETQNSTHKIQTPANNTADNTQKCNCTRDTSNGNITNSGITGVGLLKLAGCNIYGRMYRVGRIISELSGPCMECKCTEIGVQCRQLGCD